MREHVAAVRAQERQNLSGCSNAPVYTAAHPLDADLLNCRYPHPQNGREANGLWAGQRVACIAGLQKQAGCALLLPQSGKLDHWCWLSLVSLASDARDCRDLVETETASLASTIAAIGVRISRWVSAWHRHQ